MTSTRVPAPRSDAPITLELSPGFPIDLAAILGPMRRGSADPTMRLESDGTFWRAVHTPDGPGAQSLRSRAGELRVTCHGPGAGWMAERTADLIGRADICPPEVVALIDSHFTTRPGLPSLSARLSGWRVPRGHNVWESALAAVLEQKVTGLEARRAWAWLTQRYGEPAPGPVPPGTRLAPSPRAVRSVPSWEWRRMGVDRQRSDTIQRLARIPHVLDRLPGVAPAEARRLLTAVPGVGDWTYAEVAQRALGDADAVSVGDFHLARQVVYAFTGELDGTDEQMVDLLRPFSGHRFRVIRAIELMGIMPPRRGPRMAVPAHRYG